MHRAIARVEVECLHPLLGRAADIDQVSQHIRRAPNRRRHRPGLTLHLRARMLAQRRRRIDWRRLETESGGATRGALSRPREQPRGHRLLCRLQAGFGGVEVKEAGEGLTQLQRRIDGEEPGLEPGIDSHPDSQPGCVFARA